MGATLKLSTWNRAFRALKGLAGTALPQAAVVAVRCSSAGRAPLCKAIRLVSVDSNSGC